jgi:hypothetical protein
MAHEVMRGERFLEKVHFILQGCITLKAG